MKILVFIPARSGSVGIKNKNLIKINNKPLIKYTLDVAKKIKNVKIFISSDSKKIINYCKSEGINPEYIRPKKLAQSSSGMVETVLDGVNFLEKKNFYFDTVILLQPSNPLRSIKILNLAIKQFTKSKKPALASVVKMREHPFECIELLKKNKWNYLKNKKNNVNRRQQFSDNFYFIDGTIYITKIKFLKKNKTFIKKRFTEFFIQKNKWPVDIDYPEDIIIAKNFLK